MEKSLFWGDLKPGEYETGFEIIDKFENSGVQETIDLINTIFGTSFDRNDEATATQIDLLVSNLEPALWATTIQQSDVFGYIDNFVIGIDYITITTFGTGLPLTLAFNEITTPGTITTTEIT